MKTNNTMLIFLSAIVLISIGLIFFYSQNRKEVINPNANNTPMSEEEFIYFATNEDELDQYVSVKNGYQVFDAETARRDGHDEKLILYVSEIVTFQNLILQQIASPSANYNRDEVLEEFPLLKKYMDAATAYNDKNNNK